MVYSVVAGVREVFAEVLADFKIPYTRVPVETGLHSCPALPAHLQRFYAQVEKDALDSIPVFARYGIRSAAFFAQRRRGFRSLWMRPNTTKRSLSYLDMDENAATQNFSYVN